MALVVLSSRSLERIMNIHTVAENLRSTIAGKERYLAGLKEELANEYVGSVARRNTGSIISAETTARFLEINIDELRKILADVERCCENATAQSWAGSVDRQGGAFEDFELRNRDSWIEP